VHEALLIAGSGVELPRGIPAKPRQLPVIDRQTVPNAVVAARSDRRARILVVEDHAFVRAGILGLLSGQPDLTCCGEAESIAGARAAVATQKPDVVLLDLSLRDGQALDLIGILRLEYPDAKVLVLSQWDESVYAPKALQAGARGYIMKEMAADRLLEALRIVVAGKMFLSDEMVSRLTIDLTQAAKANPLRPRSDKF
jgi:DNA-binding NarL/FixJ family response regulator